MNKVFIVGTQNFLAANIAVRATQGTDLYKKACIGKKTGKMIISAISELKAWAEAVKTYVPTGESETKIYKALVAAVTGAIAKREAVAA